MINQCIKAVLVTATLCIPCFTNASDEMDWAIAGRIYAGEEQAASVFIDIDLWQLKWHVGGYIPFNELDKDNEYLKNDIDYGVAKEFEITDNLGLSLGVGALGNNIYSDYGLSYRLSQSSSLETGYRFHLEDDFSNRNEFYIGLRHSFNHYQDSESMVIQENVEEELEIEEKEIKENVEGSYLFSKNTVVYFNLNETIVIDDKPLEFLLNDLKKEEQEWSMTVIGHTDSTGGKEVNQRISERRAQSVANYFVERGIPYKKISILGKGENDPIESNETKLGREKNRRANVSIKNNPIN